MMNDLEALDILRAQGYAAGALDIHTGRVRVWIFGTDKTVDVETGRELCELAEGKLTFDEILSRREGETLVRSAAHAAAPHRTSL